MIPGSYEFLSPAWLIVLPVLAFAALLWKKSANRHAEASPAISYISPSADLQVRLPLLKTLNIDQTRSDSRHNPDMLIIWLVLSCLILALAQPIKTGQRIPDQPDQRDITFIVDTSVSMLLRDYVLEGQRISRMSFLKSFIDRFVQRLEGDRVSVIIFGESAYTFVPLTDDLQLTRRMLSRIRTTMAGRFNALGEGISLAVKEAGKNPDRRRLLILFTDAGDSTDSISPVAAAKLAKKSGLPLYTIAIGAAGYEAEEEELAGLIYHPADISLLKEIAELTGAKSYQAGDEKSLEAAIADIDQREKFKKELPPRYFRIALYPIPLLAGLFILTLYQFFRLSRSINWGSGR